MCSSQFSTSITLTFIVKVATYTYQSIIGVKNHAQTSCRPMFWHKSVPDERHLLRFSLLENNGPYSHWIIFYHAGSHVLCMLITHSKLPSPIRYRCLLLGNKTQSEEGYHQEEEEAHHLTCPFTYPWLSYIASSTSIASERSSHPSIHQSCGESH